MALALNLDNRTKILVGVAVLAVAGAAAWFLYFEDSAAPPPPKKVLVAAVPVKPAVAADASKPAEAPKPAAEPAKPAAETPKPAAEAPKPAAQPPQPVTQEPKPVAQKQARKPNPRRQEDARHCLDKSTNTEIIKCAEAYL
jgi:cytoskeletal protein RodZ